MNQPLVFLLKLEPDVADFHLAPPLGILYLASALEQNGFSVKVYHEIGTRQNLERICEDILRSRPLFVGISTMTGPSLVPSLLISDKIKASSACRVIWGGLHATMLPEQTLQSGRMDFVAIGEGEETLVEFAQALVRPAEESPHFERIKGLGFREGQRIRINPPRPFIQDLDRYRPAWHHLDYERYIYPGKYFYSEMGSKLPGDRIIAVMTSRGCPWRCGYCYNQFVNKRTHRSHSSAYTVDQLRRLIDEKHPSAVIYEDDDFFANRKRALDILQNINLPWSASIRANYLARGGEDFIGELRKYQCVELRIGAESGSPRILDIMEKDITVDDIQRSIELCQRFDIHPLTNFMVGIPGETWAETLQTLDLMDKIENSGNIVNGPSLYLPYPGTPLYDKAVSMGFRPPQTIEGWADKWGPRQLLTPFADKRTRYIGYYRILALRKDVGNTRYRTLAAVLKGIAKKRWQKRFFRFPLDYILPHLALGFIKGLGFRRASCTARKK